MNSFYNRSPFSRSTIREIPLKKTSQTPATWK